MKQTCRQIDKYIQIETGRKGDCKRECKRDCKREFKRDCKRECKRDCKRECKRECKRVRDSARARISKRERT